MFVLILLSSFVSATLFTNDNDLVLFYDYEEASGDVKNLAVNYPGFALAPFTTATRQVQGNFGFGLGFDGTTNSKGVNETAEIRTLLSSLDREGWTMCTWTNRSATSDFSSISGFGRSGANEMGAKFRRKNDAQNR